MIASTRYIEMPINMQLSRLLFLLLFFVSFLSAEQQNLRIGIPPYKSEQELRDVFKDVLLHLEKSLETKVHFFVSKDYEDMINRFKNGLIDVGFFTPNAYVEARERIEGLKYIATVLYADKSGNVNDHYKSVLVVKKDSDIKSISEIKGKRIGFTDERSTSGYIFPRILLKESGIDFKKDFASVFMLKKHPKIMGALAGGSIDVGATFEDAVNESKNEYGDIFKIIAYSKEIPYDAVVAAPHIKSNLVEKIQKALIEYKSSQANNSFKPYGYSVKSESFYDTIANAKKLLEK